MMGVKWKILDIIAGVLIVALTGGLIYALVSGNDTAISDDADEYVTMLRTDRDDLISRVELAEAEIGRLSGRIDDLESINTSLGGELENSQREVGILKEQWEYYQRILGEVGIAIGDSASTASRIGSGVEDVAAGIGEALDIIERLETGDQGSGE